MDPITAIAAATAAFNTVKKMVAMGRDVEDPFGQLGKWYSAMSDLQEAERQAKNPPLFKKLVASSSVEEEAMNVYAAKKRAAQQRRQPSRDRRRSTNRTCRSNHSECSRSRRIPA